MDEITLEMRRLLKTRTDIAKKIGEIKKSMGKGVTDELREYNVRGKVISLGKFRILILHKKISSVHQQMCHSQ